MPLNDITLRNLKPDGILELAWQAGKWILLDSNRRNPYGCKTRTGSPEKSVGIFIGM